MIKDFMLPALVYVLSFCCHARFKVLLLWDQNVAACADEYQHRTLVQLNDKWSIAIILLPLLVNHNPNVQVSDTTTDAISTSA